MKSLLFLVVILGGVAAWVYIAHPEVIAKLTSPETKKQIEDAMGNVKDASKTISGMTNAIPQQAQQ